MAETPRTQVEEPRFGVSIQPAADPVDRTIIARAPTITPDPYMNAWSEIARDFAAGYGTLKKAQVEADIPFGEQYYMESGIDGLFENGKDEQAALAELVRRGEIAEEHSIGTRIGFERASGRSAAYRERDKIEAALTDLITGSRELDPNTGLPRIATAQDIDAAITKIRAESYERYSKDPNFAWFKNSPYATEEYNKLIRSYVPDMAANFKQKARENVTEARRVLVTDELVGQAVSLGSQTDIASDDYDRLNKYIFDNVLIGGIPDPQRFLAQTFEVAGTKLLNDNPGANQTELIERYIDRIEAYRDPKTNTQIKGLYWEKAKDKLRTEAGQRSQELGDSRTKQINAGISAEFAKGDDKDSYVGRLQKLAQDLSKPGADPQLIRSQMNQVKLEFVAAAMNDPDLNKRAFIPVIADRIFNQFADLATSGIDVNNAADKSIQQLALSQAFNGQYEEAKRTAATMFNFKNRIDLEKDILNMEASKLNEYLTKVPQIKNSYKDFKETATFKPAKNSGVASISDSRPFGFTPPRETIKNAGINAELASTWSDDNEALNRRLSAIALEKIPEAEKHARMTKAIEDTAARRTAIQNKYRDAFNTLEQQLRANEKAFKPSTDALAAAYDNGIIDFDSYDRLTRADGRLMAAVKPDEKKVKSILAEALVEALNASPKDPYLVKFGDRVTATTIEGKVLTRFVLNPAGAAEINSMAEVLINRWNRAYSEGKNDQYQRIFGVALLTDPKILREVTADERVRLNLKQSARVIIEFNQKSAAKGVVEAFPDF